MQPTVHHTGANQKLLKDGTFMDCKNTKTNTGQHFINLILISATNGSCIIKNA